MSSSLRCYRRFDVLLVAILLALPAIAFSLVLLEPSISAVHVPTSSHFGVRTRVDFDAAPAGTTIDLPRRPYFARVAPVPVEAAGKDLPRHGRDGRNGARGESPGRDRVEQRRHGG